MNVQNSFAVALRLATLLSWRLYPLVREEWAYILRHRKSTKQIQTPKLKEQLCFFPNANRLRACESAEP